MKRSLTDWTWDVALNLLALVIIAALLTACGATVPVVPARTAIPVECKEPMPERPAMPTDNLTDASTLDDSVRSMQAEIVLREGYEGQLVTALSACIKPISRSSP